MRTGTRTRTRMHVSENLSTPTYLHKTRRTHKCQENFWLDIPMKKIKNKANFYIEVNKQR